VAFTVCTLPASGETQGILIPLSFGRIVSNTCAGENAGCHIPLQSVLGSLRTVTQVVTPTHNCFVYVLPLCPPKSPRRFRECAPLFLSHYHILSPTPPPLTCLTLSYLSRCSIYVLKFGVTDDVWVFFSPLTIYLAQTLNLASLDRSLHGVGLGARLPGRPPAARATGTFLVPTCAVAWLPSRPGRLYQTRSSRGRRKPAAGSHAERGCGKIRCLRCKSILSR
jgi:hypothetical protein